MGRPPLVTREQIIAAARGVFSAEGLGASIRDVAAVAGISEAAIFKRFHTKAALIVAALAPPTPDLDAIFAPLGAGDLQPALIAVMQNVVSYFRDALPVILPVVAQPDVGLDAFVDELGPNPATLIHEALAARLATLANAGKLRAVQPFAAAGLIVATAHSLALFEIMGLHSGQSPPAVIAAMADTLWQGLAPA